MPPRKDRFGQLGASGADAPGSGQTADLFQHYGIAVDPAAQNDATVAIDAQACRGCGWFLATSDPVPCPLCAEPEPHAKPAKPPASR